MKTYTSKDIAHAIMAQEVCQNTKFVLESEMKERLTKVMDTLGLLVDLQNGCPLPKYELDWNKAMSDAKELLNAGGCA